MYHALGRAFYSAMTMAQRAGSLTFSCGGRTNFQPIVKVEGFLGA